MSKLLAELKRRNVFKVATIYVVVSWLVLQVVSVVFPVFEIPIWTSRLVVILLGLGFPVAVLLAWAFDLTPEGIEWQSEVGEHHVHTHAWDWILAALLVIAIGLMVTSQLNNWGDAGTPSQPIAASDLSSPDETADQLNAAVTDALSGAASIAVLPFDSLSPDPQDEYIADGLADELLSVLGRIGELKVASRTSTAYFKNKDIDHLTIAATLRVEHVLSGSVRRAGNKIRVTAALDRAGTGELLWTDSYDRSLDDILEIQSSIAQSVAAAIVPVLSPESVVMIAAAPTTNTEAYDFYLRGRDYLRRPRNMATLTSATELFDRAINLDPRFAQAFAGRCEANLASYQYTKNTAYFENAEISCHRALTINDRLWDVRVALGNLYFTNGQLDRSILELQAAMQQQPNSVDPYIDLARIYAKQGRKAEAEATFEQAEELESGYWRLHNELGHFNYDETNYDEAIRRFRRVAELAPEHGVGQNNLGNTYLAIGDLEKAAQAFSNSPNPSRFTYSNRGLVYYYQGAYSKAVEDQKQSLDIAPDNHRSWGQIADAYRFIPGGEDDARAAYLRAIELAEREDAVNPSWQNVVRLALYYVHTGQNAKSESQLENLFETTESETAYYFASLASLHLGNREKSLEYLQESVNRGFSKALILADPDFESLHGDDSFDAILATD